MAELIRIPGHGIYWLVNGQIFTTPCPKPWDVPVEIGEFGRIIAGPYSQLT